MHCLRHCLLDTKKLRRKKNLLESFNCREFASAGIPFFVKLFFYVNYIGKRSYFTQMFHKKC